MYKINRDNLKKEKNFYRLFFYMGLMFCIIFTLTMGGSIFNFADGMFTGGMLFPLIFIWLFTGLFMKIGLSGMKKVDEKNMVQRKYD